MTGQDAVLCDDRVHGGVGNEGEGTGVTGHDSGAAASCGLSIAPLSVPVTGRCARVRSGSFFCRGATPHTSRHGLLQQGIPHLKDGVTGAGGSPCATAMVAGDV